jgi:hypothetical protein
VHTTHLYVKFKPKNSDEYELLHTDSTLAFLDYPIESRVVMNGDYYHDPSLPDSVPTYQYTAVKVDYHFNNEIEYEILDKLYIPEADEAFNYMQGGSEDCFVDKLLNQAYLQTGNDDEIIEVADCKEKVENAQRWYLPAGNIRVFDTRLNNTIGMEGVRVQARRWFIVQFTRTSYNGDYIMPIPFNRPCNYSIWFGNLFFAVRYNLFNLTYWINGPRQRGNWNYQLNDSYQRFAGHVFRGAYRYQLKDIGDLQRPWRTPFFKRQIYIAKDDNGGGSAGQQSNFTPVIKVWRYVNGSFEYDSDEVFSTTCHETAHRSHIIRMNAGIIQFNQVSTQLKESWAVAVEWYLSHIEYKERGITNYGKEDYSINVLYPNRFAYQYWNEKQYGKDYTSLYIDIVDNHNQLNVFYNSSLSNGTIDDQVSGYSLPYIERHILKHVYGLESLRHELIDNNPSQTTEAQIELLLSHF